MNKRQFKQFYSALRKIKNNRGCAGSNGYYSDLLTGFNVSWDTVQYFVSIRRSKNLVVGRYTKAYIEAQENRDYWEAYGERIVCA